MEQPSVSQLPGIPVAHQYDPVLKKLTIRGADTVPPEIYQHADDIEILDMSNGNLRDLPADLSRLHRLRIAFFSYNPLTRMPTAFADCKNLEMLGMRSCGMTEVPEDSLPMSLRGFIVTDNQLPTLPASIGKLTKLQKIMAAGNRFTALPKSMNNLHNLQCLRVSVSEFTAAPTWLLELPRLGWYTDSGNPFGQTLAARLPQTPHVNWANLTVGKKLGESVKNVVHQARLDSTGQDVALKLYGQAVTTDGLPIDEMRANIAAGSHPNIIKVIDRVAGAPDGQEALALTLIPPEFGNLGLPPDFQTLVRDVFTPGITFSLPVVRQILSDISSALAHLHAQGVMHGDVYAHNILTSATGQSYLGDFGAATLYDPAEGPARERSDVCGFGYLVDDLLAHCPQSSSALQQLRTACLSPRPSDRPSFLDINELLA